MATNVVTLTINQGATFSQTITLDPVIDLTGGTGTCQIREKASQAKPIIASPTVTLSGTPTNGVFTLYLTAAQTLAFPVNGESYSDTTTYYYDVNMVISGTTTRVAHGPCIVSPAVTR